METRLKRSPTQPSTPEEKRPTHTRYCARGMKETRADVPPKDEAHPSILTRRGARRHARGVGERHRAAFHVEPAPELPSESTMDCAPCDPSKRTQSKRETNVQATHNQHIQPHTQLLRMKTQKAIWKHDSNAVLHSHPRLKRSDQPIHATVRAA